SCAISLEGNCAIITEISSTMVQMRTACSKPVTSKFLGAPSPRRNCIRLSEARLQAVSSRNMYSLHGLEARISPPAGQVCQSLMLVWNWMPGSAQDQAAREIFSHNSRAFTVLATFPARSVRFQSRFSSTAFRKSSVTRTELLEFWPETEL